MKIGKKARIRIWGDGSLRLFISHTNSCKNQATELKDQLARFGVAAFVAHEDIEPSKRWQKEILRALFSMHMLVALFSQDFLKSKWTDQEVGVAVGREVPIISVRMGTDPYGFVGDVQAISGSDGPEHWARAVYELSLDNVELRAQAVDGFILAIKKVETYSQADSLFERYLPKIDTLTSTQHASLISAFNQNDQVRGAFTYNRFDVPGQLKRITNLTHHYEHNGKLGYEPS